MLVTGGAGYIGSHACKALQPRRLRVVVFDNLVAGHREAVRYGELVEGDIADIGAVRAALRRSRDLGGDALRGVSRRRRIGARAGRATTATTSAAR